MVWISLFHSAIVALFFDTHYQPCWNLSILYFCYDFMYCALVPTMKYRQLFLIHHMIALSSLIFGLRPGNTLFKPMAQVFVAAERSNVALNVSKWLLPNVKRSYARLLILVSEFVIYGWFRIVVMGRVVFAHIWSVGMVAIPAVVLYCMGLCWTLLILRQIWKLLSPSKRMDDATLVEEALSKNL